MYLSGQTMSHEESTAETLSLFETVGLDAVEFKLDTEDYLDDPGAQEALLEQVASHGLELDLLAATGINPLHPVDEAAERADDHLRATIRLASQMGVDTVTTFAGLPGGAPEDEAHNWIVSPFPTSFGERESYLEYQWEDVAIPYWRDLGAYAEEQGVDVALEVHLGTLVSTAPDVVRLREATSERIGAYVDPPHLSVQGIDVVDSIHHLADHDALFHFEASDVQFHEVNRRLKGNLDMTPLSEPADRAWTFTAVGHGHRDGYWTDVVDALYFAGYDGGITVQQHKTPVPIDEGLQKAVDYLDAIIWRTDSPWGP